MIRKTGILIFIIVLGTTTTWGQLLPITKYWPTDSAPVLEQYFVLSSDTTIKDSTYFMYAKNGQILKKGFYNKGEKAGQWSRYLRGWRVQTSGYYENNEFSGCLFGYDSLGNFDVVEYFDRGTAYNDSLPLQEKKIESVFESLKERGFKNDSLMLVRFQELESLIEMRKTMTDQDTKLKWGHRLVYQLVYHNEFLPYFELEKEKLGKAHFALINHGLLLDKEFLSPYIDSLTAEADSLMACDSLGIVLENGPLIRSKIRQRLASLDSLQNQKHEIAQQLDALRASYQAVFPDLYTSELDSIDIKNKEISSTFPLGKKIEMRSLLLLSIANLDKQFKELSTAYEEITYGKRSIEKGFKTKYPSTFAKALEQINIEQSYFESNTILKEKLTLGKKLVGDIKTNLQFFQAIDSIEAVISEQYPPLKQKYLQNYPALFSKEVKPINNLITDFNRITPIKDKKEMGQSILDTLAYFDQSHQRLSSIDSTLNNRYATVKANYKEHFRPIYKEEVQPIEGLIKSYSVSNNSMAKLNSGSMLLDKFTDLETYFILMQEQNSALDKRFSLIAESYKTNFPPIYKTTFKVFYEKRKNISGANTCKRYIEKQTEFLTDIGGLEEKLDEIQVQKASIDTYIAKTQELYQFDFPVIYGTEVKEEISKIDDYNNEGLIDKKLKTGELIIETLGNLHQVHAQLKEENTKINSEFESLAENYKTEFPSLYRTLIDPLKDQVKDYRQNGYHIPKLNLSNDIVMKLEHYAVKYNLFKAQSDLLKNQFNEFIYKYKDRDQVKKMYKKGKWAYDQLMGQYEQELDFEKKEEKGKEIELLLLQFLSLADKDNSIINSEIRSAKTIEEIKKAIGLD